MVQPVRGTVLRGLLPQPHPPHRTTQTTHFQGPAPLLLPRQPRHIVRSSSSSTKWPFCSRRRRRPRRRRPNDRRPLLRRARHWRVQSLHLASLAQIRKGPPRKSPIHPPPSPPSRTPAPSPPHCRSKCLRIHFPGRHSTNPPIPDKEDDHPAEADLRYFEWVGGCV